VERAVEGAGSGLQEEVGSFPGPLHLLLLGKAPADNEIDGGFSKGGRDDLAVVPARRIVRDCGGIVPDVGGQPGRRLGQPRQTRIRAGQGGDILGQRAGARQDLVGVAVPQPPLDPLQSILQGGCFKGIVATLCRCWRTVSRVPATGRTSLSKAVVMPKEIRDAQRLSR
jgi:hypothetical protein